MLYLVKEDEEWVEHSHIELGLQCHFSQLLHHILVSVGIHDVIGLDDKARGQDTGVVFVEGHVQSKRVGRAREIRLQGKVVVKYLLGFCRTFHYVTMAIHMQGSNEKFLFLLIMFLSIMQLQV